MSKFKVTALMPEDPTGTLAHVVEIEADSYQTKATQGAGMIADFHTARDSNPFATFARVLSVQRSEDVEDVQYADILIRYYGADGELHTPTMKWPHEPGSQIQIDLTDYTKPGEDQVILTNDEAQYLSNLVTHPDQFTNGKRWVDIYRKLNG